VSAPPSVPSLYFFSPHLTHSHPTPTPHPPHTHPNPLRYMAPEVLQSVPRQASADMFSLGISMYEVCLPLPPPPAPGMWGHPQYSNPLIAHGSLLPSEGPMWHRLRGGQADPLPGRPPAIGQVIAACMAPEPGERPTAQQILALPLVHAASLEPDPVLLAAKSRPVPPPSQFHRSISLSGPDALGLFTDCGGGGECGGGGGGEEDEHNAAAAAAGGLTAAQQLARNRVSTPTNFMTGGSANLWLWPAPTPPAEDAGAGMETSPTA